MCVTGVRVFNIDIICIIAGTGISLENLNPTSIGGVSAGPPLISRAVLELLMAAFVRSFVFNVLFSVFCFPFCTFCKFAHELPLLVAWHGFQFVSCKSILPTWEVLSTSCLCLPLKGKEGVNHTFKMPRSLQRLPWNLLGLPVCFTLKCSQMEHYH